ncbi:coiled-coil domain-containing protein 157-like isoform X2 [Acanthaster planci]|uniref:Coiled-coil domain-containing protein 157-like isoform X2 n=1 Tax=Acanthaster planci TaxID=133434 RepID=A0A8B7XXM1_ACAPL|nr:coiled-coil domain-containing protein 157-like isoform X2 [Acanthaster planci]
MKCDVNGPVLSKISSDLDIPALLEEHSFSDDTEDNQVAHIILFELVIDRMMLLLQGFTRFVEMLLSGSQGRPPTSGLVVGSQMSIGLVIKKFWNKMVQLNNLCQQLQAENKAKSKTVNKLEVINQELQLQSLETSKELNLNSPGDSLKPTNPKTSNSPLAKSLSPGFGGLLPPNSSKDHSSVPLNSGDSHSAIAKDIRTVSSQTLETAFVPCEACACVQLSLKQVADLITEVCSSQGLQSSIAKHRTQGIDVTMTAADVTRWTTQQGKDLNQIKQCLQDLLDQIDPLKSDLSASEAECSELKKGISEKSLELKKEKEAREAQRKQHQTKLKEVERQHAESIVIVHQRLEEIKKGKKQDEEELSALKRELQKQCEARQVLEEINQRLTQEAEGNTSNRATVLRLESQVQELSRQLQTTSEELQSTSKQLGKEQARNRSIDKHGQSMQNKHDALVRRVDELDEECTDLRDSLAEAEEGQEQLMEQLKETKREVEELKEELQKEKALAASIQEEKRFLESSISDLQTMIVTLERQLEDAQSRERMLVQYPDMNPGIVPQGPVPTGEGDNPSDMQQQVQSNNIRIQILEEQNNLLRKSITKMLAEQDSPQQRVQVSGPAIPLWQSSSTTLAKDHHDNSRNKTPVSQQFQQHSEQLYTYKSPAFSPDSRATTKTLSPESQAATKPGSTSYHSRKQSPRREVFPSHGLQKTTLAAKPPQTEGRDASRTKQGGKQTSSSSNVNVAKLAAAGGNTSLSAYVKLKQSGAITAGEKSTSRATDGKASSNSRPPLKSRQGWIHSEYNKGSHRSQEHYSPLNTFVCPSCDKMYTSEQDLEIHQSYCYR